MAKIKVAGSTKKVKVAKTPATADAKFTGEEPVWDTARAEKFTDVEFDSAFRVSLRYYNYYFNVKDFKKYLVEWARVTPAATKLFDKQAIDKFAKSSDILCAFTPCAIARAHTKGMPLKEKHVTYMLDAIKLVLDKLDKGVEVAEEVENKTTPTVKVSTIQDRLRGILDTHLLHFLELEDKVLAGETVDPKVHEYLTAKNVPHAMLSKLASPFEKHAAELAEAKAGKCPQLNEGYADYKTGDYKRIEAFYTKIADGISQYTLVKKATKKAAVRKPPQKEKLVARLKYLKSDAVSKVVSISPVDIIGAQTLYVYNVKTRKLGCYQADDLAGTLTVKGASIVGFNEVTSTQKTLRKPEEQLREFLKAGKVELRKFLGNIKSVETKLNGRVNSDTVLLKVL